MKRIILTLVTLAFFAQANAQLMLSASGAYLKSADNSDAKGQWGGGLAVKYLIADKFGIGATVKGFARNTATNTYGEITVKSGDVIVPALITLDYRFGQSENVKPYIGLDGGAYFTSTVLDVSSSTSTTNSTTNRKTYFGVAPKIGIEAGATWIGVFAQVQYNATFGSGDSQNVTVPGVNTSADVKPTGKFWTFEAGIFVKLQANQ
jgi:outer membrane protein W